MSSHVMDKDTATGVPEVPRLKGRGTPLRERFFQLSLWASLAVGVVFLASLLAYVVVEAWPRLDSRILTNFPDIIDPSNSKRPVGGHGHALGDRVHGDLLPADRRPRRHLPGGVRGSEPLVEPADRDQHPEPGGRTVDRLRHPRARHHLPRPRLRPDRADRLAHPVAAGPADRDHLLPGGDPRRTAVHPPGILALGATQWQTIWRQVLPAAVPGMATGSILALSRAIGEAAPLLLLGGLTFITFNPTGVESPFTVLPIQIYGWISQSRAEFVSLASAAIVVLLVILLAMNSVAIWLRNRYSRRW